MRRRTLGTTGLQVSELAVGTWGLSGDGYGPVTESEADRVIERALALGISLFETSDSYAHGEMERRLGRLLPDDAQSVVVTKIGTDRNASPARKRFDRDFLARAFEGCRERLRRAKLDVVLLHNPSTAALGKPHVAAFFDDLKRAGHLTSWGVSTSQLDVARSALEAGAQVLAMPYNALQSRHVVTLQPLLEQHQAGLLGHSVLAYGLLAGSWSSDKEFAPGDHRSERWTPDELRARLRQLRALRPAVHGDVHSLRAVALRFALSNQQISSVVLGPRSSLQLDQLVREAGKAPPYLTPDVLNGLRARLSDAGVDS